ncbi:hypothetical protein [Rubrobacter indicoceani]|uniref:hypothetical protein n=1 Tax=Rubrobacter indicoceani TaxID=2051957 RepID=UPI000E5BB4C0|nr:hypothetical protein [Rubrobacter indicoceani]
MSVARGGSGGHVGGANELWPGLEAPSIVRDAPRPATILRVADALEFQGGEVLELFREVSSPIGQAVYPIHLKRSGSEFFIEVETGRWTDQVARSIVRRVAVLRDSDDGEREVLILSAYPVPDKVSFFTGVSIEAGVQLSVLGAENDDPEAGAGAFLRSARRYWMDDLDYGTQYLPVAEELVLDLAEGFVLSEFVRSFGFYLGETIRRAAPGEEARWSREGMREPVLVISNLELDPIGKARAFIENGERDSVAFYAGYVLRELGLDAPAR